ncbi:MAG: peptide methionine sulfoxide reductase [Candidatus Sedimenticola endophacoides]|uniref:Peptide methionine sulfoxide reductase MsrA n=1 Tax=Candidatus Sedimenticola endophacoides TaxID=2548426 RepID=A0A657Q801_9GAMM|nr:MAG: peptide methionine sulfoxide reductase [Candidatus Sedimenticola endophacoides]OQX32427.1 MAG: peptide methionine sulfoxide reductase [Candidatus Sedimenticola endophacoides]OQX33148.1 MAG: peptide methionine sulfoxide reductase [Candidatus Sedimenticola endophacoides]OQX38738.1 MAG: peptide methionine sulfoxide reductase [Candidatus Sedimenticola endophacoides]OQX40554.1 MAG: peptide methionine sulfoxide reductase [Candidatus Sedimenticola endophacoides]
MLAAGVAATVAGGYLHWQDGHANQAPAARSAPVVSDSIVLGMGCFWGAEKRMAALPGVVDVISGYAGGSYPDPSYRKIIENEHRDDMVNHAEVVKVTYDPALTSVAQVLAGFWENHDPTQGDRQGNDMGSNYRSAIYYNSDTQRVIALATRDAYQKALTEAGFGGITTEIAPLAIFYPAEEYHQDYLEKNPKGYCGIGGTNVRFPTGMDKGGHDKTRNSSLDADGLSREEQLVVFEAEECPFCKLFKDQVLDDWKADVPVTTTRSPLPPGGWTLEKELWATPTIVLFRDGREVSRYTGYNGEKQRFWDWFGHNTLSEDEIRVAYKSGTERAFTGSLLDNREEGTYVDPVTGEPLFRSGTKFKSGTGWPSFFQPIEGAVTLHEDKTDGMRRTEVRSASSGIHLGHVFDDGPPPTGKRYCINSDALRFVPDH